MSILFMDGFDHYGDSDIGEKWTGFSGCLMGTGTARRPTSRYIIVVSTLTKVLPGHYATCIFGMAIRCPGHPFDRPLLRLSDLGTEQCRIVTNANGQVTAMRGLSTVLGTSALVLQTDVWFYLEAKVTIHPTAGAVRVRVNGVDCLALTNVNTQSSGLSRLNKFELSAAEFDDLYVCDTAGAAPTQDFLGDSRIDLLLPAGDGTDRAWTPSSGTAHWSLVNDAVPNDDTSYLSATTVGVQETQTFAPLPSLPSPVIYGVQHSINARKDEVGVRLLTSVIRSGATLGTGATTHAVANTYGYYSQLWESDPATGAPWTVAAINALEAGFVNG